MLTLMTHAQHMGTTAPILLPQPSPICAGGQIKWSRTNNGYLSVWKQFFWDLTGFLRASTLQMRSRYRDLQPLAANAGSWFICSWTVRPVNIHSSSNPCKVKYLGLHLWMSLSFQWATNLFWFMKVLGCFTEALELIPENLTSIMHLL